MHVDRSAGLALEAAACFAGFALLGWLVASRDPALRIDVEAAALRGQGTTLAIFFTRLGRWYAITAITLAAVVFATALHAHPAVIVGLFVAQVLGQGAVNAVKLTFKRTRPDDWLHRLELGHSYPSGHSATAIVFFLGLLLLVLRSPQISRDLAVTVAVLLAICVVGIPWSRMALGAHYPTDVLGGLLFGLGWLIVYAAVSSHIGLIAPPF